MRKPVVVILLLIVFVCGCLAERLAASEAQGGRCALTIRNGTGRDFHRLHISWSRDKEWGPNLLPGVLKPGASTGPREMVPADYDLMLVDANSRQCTLRNVRVSTNMTLDITEDKCR